MEENWKENREEPMEENRDKLLEEDMEELPEEQEEHSEEIYGYIFAWEPETLQEEQEVLNALQIPKKNVFADSFQLSGKQRPMLKRLMRRLRKKDLVYIKDLSFLGNNYEEILGAWQMITKEKEADIAVLNTPFLDTRRGKEIMNTFLGDVVAETLFFVAGNERTKNRRRQAEGYQAAKERGVTFGRPAAPLPENFDSVYKRWKEGEMTGTMAARECKMPLSTFRYRAKLYGLRDW